MQITENGADTGIACNIILLSNADTPEQHAPQSQPESHLDAAALVNALHLFKLIMHFTVQELKHLQNVKLHLYCPQMFLSLDFQCMDDVSELK